MTGIVLKSTQFRREREPSWRELETLVGVVEKRGIRSLAPEQLMRLTNLYRATLSSLSVARAISLDHNLVTYLEGLAGRVYFCVYGTRARVGGVVSSFFLERLPRLVASIRWHLLIAAAFLALGIAAGWLLVLDDPERYYLLVPDGVAQGRSPATPTDDLRDVLYDRPDENLADALQIFASFLFTHNAVTGIFAFGLGFALGLPTLVLLVYNGVLLGAFAALYQMRGLGIDFWGWILPHGVTEFLAILLCGAAGLVLADSIVFPGLHSRKTALAMRGRVAGQVVLGAVILFFIASLFEGFFRQLVTDVWVRYGTAAAVGIFWIAYFCFLPRLRRDG